MKTVTFDETKWKLAPVEPTQEMIDAMPPVEEIGYWAMYSAALDAAPAAPPQPVTLTDEEIDKIADEHEDQFGRIRVDQVSPFARAIIAAIAAKVETS